MELSRHSNIFVFGSDRTICIAMGAGEPRNPRDTFIGELRGNVCHNLSYVVRRFESVPSGYSQAKVSSLI